MISWDQVAYFTEAIASLTIPILGLTYGIAIAFKVVALLFSSI